LKAVGRIGFGKIGEVSCRPSNESLCVSKCRILDLTIKVQVQHVIEVWRRFADFPFEIEDSKLLQALENNGKCTTMNFMST